MIDRQLSTALKNQINYFPVTALTGPRQSGKSTLIQNTFKEYKYYNLEEKSVYERAKNDPTGFINSCPFKTTIDEAQLIPDLFNAIQVRVDEEQKNGAFILTGSHNFLLQKNITQSLAGRVSYLRLLPFSFKELAFMDLPINNFMFSGGYPRIYDSKIPEKIYYTNYINTYVNRDVKGFLNVRDDISFKGLLQLLAANTGSILNYNRLANDLEIDARTVKDWISILVASSIITMLPPYYKNLRKCTIKSPKVYFADTGLLCHLLKIKSYDEIYEHPMYGHIFENFVITEVIKNYLNNGIQPDLYFYRNNHKVEIDLIDCTEGTTKISEIKAGQTFKESFTKTLNMSEKLIKGDFVKFLIYNGSESFKFKDIHVMNPFLNMK